MKKELSSFSCLTNHLLFLSCIVLVVCRFVLLLQHGHHHAVHLPLLRRHQHLAPRRLARARPQLAPHGESVGPVVRSEGARLARAHGAVKVRVSVSKLYCKTEICLVRSGLRKRLGCPFECVCGGILHTRGSGQRDADDQEEYCGSCKS